MEEITGDGRKLHNREVQDFCCSSNISVQKSRGMKWAERVSRVGGGKKILVVEGRRTLRRPGRRWIILKLILSK
jgi:hypothetical protein